MNILQAVKMAAKSIFSNKARSMLTMLGIIIGLAAVIILVSYTQGQNMAMNAYYESLGNNRVNVNAYTGRGSTDLTKELNDYLLQLGDLSLGMTPSGYVGSEPVIKFESKTLARDWNNYDYENDIYPEITLGNDQFAICNNYTIDRGRELSFLDIERNNQVCVLGAQTAKDLFGFADPVGKNITLDGMPFLIVGVFESKSGGITASSDEDRWLLNSMIRMDRLILIPSTMTRYFNDNRPIEQYVIKARDADATREIITLVGGFLDGLIPENSGYYDVYTEDTWQASNNEASAIQQRFLVGIAAISLLVGGIGIMNIMLVTVTERTREIGIRKAIGAERKSIIAQFLIEAAMICFIGGILGIAVGVLGTLVICKVSFNAIIVPEVSVALGAAGISIIIGIVFGMYPAIKASGLQPVVALRAD